MSRSTDLVRQGLTAAVDKGIAINTSMVETYIARARRTRPGASPAEIIVSLERQYMATVATMGAAGGAAAAIPGPWSPAAVALNVAEVGTFLEASSLFILAVANVHGIRVDDLERRRTLVLAILMGNSGAAFVEKVAGKTGPYWARSIVKAIPMSAINLVNKGLGPRFITKYGTKQGLLVLGRELPFGFGAAIGAGGNALLGKATISAARKAFGPPPADPAV